MTTTGRIKAKLIKSSIGRSRAHKACIAGLGLRRISHSVEVEDTPSIRGMINKVSYLLEVEYCLPEVLVVERLLPDVVGERASLKECLLEKIKASSQLRIDVNDFLSCVPTVLLSSGAFMDRLTKLWRYEFGVPYDLGEEEVYGTHMWVPVNHLFAALCIAYLRLNNERRVEYLNRLASPKKHQAALVEMIPADKIDSAIPLKFEVPNLGVGNKTIDWEVGPHEDRKILLEVKKRDIDFIEQAKAMGNSGAVTEPDHDVELLFRSVEDKFLHSDPSVQLQGCWIVTNIKQNHSLLSQAFEKLDPGKVHFAILGDWESDGHLLVKRKGDFEYLQNVFNLTQSSRFTFQ